MPNHFDMKSLFFFILAIALLSSCSSGSAYDCEIQVSFADELKRISNPESKEFEPVLNAALKKYNPEKELFIDVFFQVAKDKFPNVAWSSFFQEVYGINEYSGNSRVKGTLMARRNMVIDAMKKDLKRNYSKFGIQHIESSKKVDLISFTLENAESVDKIKLIANSNNRFAIYETADPSEIIGLDRKINFLLHGYPEDALEEQDTSASPSLDDLEDDLISDSYDISMTSFAGTNSAVIRVPTDQVPFILKALNSESGTYNDFRKILFVSDRSIEGNEPVPGYTRIHACRVPTDESLIITNADIEMAEAKFDEVNQEPSVQIVFSDEGRNKWSEITARNVGNVLVMVLNGKEVISAPIVVSQISSGMVQISGNMTVDDTKNLASKISSQYWTVPCKITKAEIRK